MTPSESSYGHLCHETCRRSGGPRVVPVDPLCGGPARCWPDCWSAGRGRTPPPGGAPTVAVGLRPGRAADGSADAIDSVGRRTRRSGQMVRRRAPRYRDIHPRGSDVPEECNLLRARSSPPWTWRDRGGAELWRPPPADLQSAYAEMRAHVQLIQGTEPPRSWVLRTPALLFATGAVLTAFPDAIVIQLHCDPLVCLTSYCSLAATWGGQFRGVDPLALGPRWMELWAQGVERSVAARESASATATFLDFDYRDLIARRRRSWRRPPGPGQGPRAAAGWGTAGPGRRRPEGSAAPIRTRMVRAYDRCGGRAVRRLCGASASPHPRTPVRSVRLSRPALILRQPPARLLATICRNMVNNGAAGTCWP